MLTVRQDRAQLLVPAARSQLAAGLRAEVDTLSGLLHRDICRLQAALSTLLPQCFRVHVRMTDAYTMHIDVCLDLTLLGFHLSVEEAQLGYNAFKALVDKQAADARKHSPLRVILQLYGPRHVSIPRSRRALR